MRLSDVAALDLQGRRLAYLSACASARPTDPQLLDEATHLTSSFLVAGFTDVIGTLWEIDDQVAVEFARTVYEQLQANLTAPNPQRAAVAVHAATTTLRERSLNNPLQWASHIHTGA